MVDPDPGLNGARRPRCRVGTMLSHHGQWISEEDDTQHSQDDNAQIPYHAKHSKLHICSIPSLRAPMLRGLVLAIVNPHVICGHPMHVEALNAAKRGMAGLKNAMQI
ncbi:hypothetical protein [Tardiphaga sp.]|uniref:hypothetical protein n=1 Tax=Tardiphaga sp. TaxID=1926292 RepID=UPI00352B6D48